MLRYVSHHVEGHIFLVLILQNEGMSTHQHSTEQTGLAVDAAEVAKLLQVSLRHVNALNASGRLPRPLRLGRSVRWLRSDLEAWLEAGAPSRETWEQMRQTDSGIS